jgi:2-polyprenyl-3-methyl-5-hydroxy-6-metoxy-1,4-benzoquinol methylase/predicted nucleotidyltransferase
MEETSKHLQNRPLISDFEKKGTFICWRNKLWIKVVALFVVGVFLYQDILWATNYNLGFLTTPSFYVKPLYELDPKLFNEAVAKSIYRFLKPLTNKELDQIQIKDDLIVDASSKGYIEQRELKKIYEWLKRPNTPTVPCSAYVLYNLLKSRGVNARIEQLSTLLILIDILSGNISSPPPQEEKRIYNSLYALEKTARYFGYRLYPVKILPSDYKSLSNFLPFIAHLSYQKPKEEKQSMPIEGHFVLVTKIGEEKVFYFYDKGDTFLPKEKFFEKFTGYILVPSHLSGVISEEEAKNILGGYSRKYHLPTFDEVFPEPSWSDIAISGAFTITSFCFGGMDRFAMGAFISDITSALTEVGIREWGWSPSVAQIASYFTTAALANGVNTHSFKQAIIGGLKGLMVGSAKLGAYELIKDTGFYKDNPFIANQLASSVGGFVGYAGFYALMAGLRVNIEVKTQLSEQQTNYSNEESLPISHDQSNQVSYSTETSNYQLPWGDSVTPSTSGIRIETEKIGGGLFSSPEEIKVAWVSPDYFGGGFWGGLKLAYYDVIYNNDWLSNLVSLGIEYALDKNKDSRFKYNRLLAQGIGNVTQSLIRGNGIDFKGMLSRGILSGLASAALSSLGGEFDRKTGKNKWGLTELQMSAINWTATSLFDSTFAALSTQKGQRWKIFGTVFVDNFKKFANRQTSLLAPYRGGWADVENLERIARFGGFADFKANADRLMSITGKSWDELIETGHIESLFPSFANSLVRYTASNLHYAATDNAIGILGYSKTIANFFGIPHRYVYNYKENNSAHSWLMTQKDQYLYEGINYFDLGGSKIKAFVDDTGFIINNSQGTQIISFEGGIRERVETPVSLHKTSNKEPQLTFGGEHSYFLQNILGEISQNGGELRIHARHKLKEGQYGLYDIHINSDGKNVFLKLSPEEKVKVISRRMWFDKKEKIPIHNPNRYIFEWQHPLQEKVSKDQTIHQNVEFPERIITLQGKEIPIKRDGNRILGYWKGEWYPLEMSNDGTWKLNVGWNPFKNPFKFRDVHFRSSELDQLCAKWIGAEKIEGSRAYYSDGSIRELSGEKRGIWHILQEIYNALTFDSLKKHHGFPQIEVPGRNWYLYPDTRELKYSDYTLGVKNGRVIAVTKGPSFNNLFGFIAQGGGIVNRFSLEGWQVKSYVYDKGRDWLNFKKGVGRIINGKIAYYGFTPDIFTASNNAIDFRPPQGPPQRPPQSPSLSGSRDTRKNSPETFTISYQMKRNSDNTTTTFTPTSFSEATKAVYIYGTPEKGARVGVGFHNDIVEIEGKPLEVPASINQEGEVVYDKIISGVIRFTPYTIIGWGKGAKFGRSFIITPQGRKELEGTYFVFSHYDNKIIEIQTTKENTWMRKVGSSLGLKGSDQRFLIFTDENNVENLSARAKVYFRSPEGKIISQEIPIENINALANRFNPGKTVSATFLKFPKISFSNQGGKNESSSVLYIFPENIPNNPKLISSNSEKNTYKNLWVALRPDEKIGIGLDAVLPWNSINTELFVPRDSSKNGYDYFPGFKFKKRGGDYYLRGEISKGIHHLKIWSFQKKTIPDQVWTKEREDLTYIGNNIGNIGKNKNDKNKYKGGRVVPVIYHKHKVEDKVEDVENEEIWKPGEVIKVGNRWVVDVYTGYIPECVYNYLKQRGFNSIKEMVGKMKEAINNDNKRFKNKFDKKVASEVAILRLGKDIEAILNQYYRSKDGKVSFKYDLDTGFFELAVGSPSIIKEGITFSPKPIVRKKEETKLGVLFGPSLLKIFGSSLFTMEKEGKDRFIGKGQSQVVFYSFANPGGRIPYVGEVPSQTWVIKVSDTKGKEKIRVWVAVNDEGKEVGRIAIEKESLNGNYIIGLYQAGGWLEWQNGLKGNFYALTNGYKIEGIASTQNGKWQEGEWTITKDGKKIAENISSVEGIIGFPNQINTTPSETQKKFDEVFEEVQKKKPPDQESKKLGERIARYLENQTPGEVTINFSSQQASGKVHFVLPLFDNERTNFIAPFRSFQPQYFRHINYEIVGGFNKNHPSAPGLRLGDIQIGSNWFARKNHPSGKIYFTPWGKIKIEEETAVRVASQVKIEKGNHLIPGKDVVVKLRIKNGDAIFKGRQTGYIEDNRNGKYELIPLLEDNKLTGRFKPVKADKEWKLVTDVVQVDAYLHNLLVKNKNNNELKRINPEEVKNQNPAGELKNIRSLFYIPGKGFKLPFPLKTSLWLEPGKWMELSFSPKGDQKRRHPQTQAEKDLIGASSTQITPNGRYLGIKNGAIFDFIIYKNKEELWRGVEGYLIGEQSIEIKPAKLIREGNERKIKGTERVILHIEAQKKDNNVVYDRQGGVPVKNNQSQGLYIGDGTYLVRGIIGAGARIDLGYKNIKILEGKKFALSTPTKDIKINDSLLIKALLQANYKSSTKKAVNYKVFLNQDGFIGDWGQLKNTVENLGKEVSDFFLPEFKAASSSGNKLTQTGLSYAPDREKEYNYEGKNNYEGKKVSSQLPQEERSRVSSAFYSMGHTLSYVMYALPAGIERGLNKLGIPAGKGWQQIFKYHFKEAGKNTERVLGINKERGEERKRPIDNIGKGVTFKVGPLLMRKVSGKYYPDTIQINTKGLIAPLSRSRFKGSGKDSLPLLLRNTPKDNPHPLHSHSAKATALPTKGFFYIEPEDGTFALPLEYDKQKNAYKVGSYLDLRNTRISLKNPLGVKETIIFDIDKEIHLCLSGKEIATITYNASGVPAVELNKDAIKQITVFLEEGDNTQVVRYNQEAAQIFLFKGKQLEKKEEYTRTNALIEQLENGGISITTQRENLWVNFTLELNELGAGWGFADVERLKNLGVIGNNDYKATLNYIKNQQTKFINGIINLKRDLLDKEVMIYKDGRYESLTIGELLKRSGIENFNPSKIINVFLNKFREWNGNKNIDWTDKDRDLLDAFLSIIYYKTKPSSSALPGYNEETGKLEGNCAVMYAGLLSVAKYLTYGNIDESVFNRSLLHFLTAKTDNHIWPVFDPQREGLSPGELSSGAISIELAKRTLPLSSPYSYIKNTYYPDIRIEISQEADPAKQIEINVAYKIAELTHKQKDAIDFLKVAGIIKEKDITELNPLGGPYRPILGSSLFQRRILGFDKKGRPIFGFVYKRAPSVEEIIYSGGRRDVKIGEKVYKNTAFLNAGNFFGYQWVVLASLYKGERKHILLKDNKVFEISKSRLSRLDPKKATEEIKGLFNNIKDYYIMVKGIPLKISSSDIDNKTLPKINFNYYNNLLNFLVNYNNLLNFLEDTYQQLHPPSQGLKDEIGSRLSTALGDAIIADAAVGLLGTAASLFGISPPGWVTAALILGYVAVNQLYKPTKKFIWGNTRKVIDWALGDNYGFTSEGKIRVLPEKGGGLLDFNVGGNDAFLIGPGVIGAVDDNVVRKILKQSRDEASSPEIRQFYSDLLEYQHHLDTHTTYEGAVTLAAIGSILIDVGEALWGARTKAIELLKSKEISWVSVSREVPLPERLVKGKIKSVADIVKSPEKGKIIEEVSKLPSQVKEASDDIINKYSFQIQARYPQLFEDYVRVATSEGIKFVEEKSFSLTENFLPQFKKSIMCSYFTSAITQKLIIPGLQINLIDWSIRGIFYNDWSPPSPTDIIRNIAIGRLFFRYLSSSSHIENIGTQLFISHLKDVGGSLLKAGVIYGTGIGIEKIEDKLESSHIISQIIKDFAGIYAIWNLSKSPFPLEKANSGILYKFVEAPHPIFGKYIQKLSQGIMKGKIPLVERIPLIKAPAGILREISGGTGLFLGSWQFPIQASFIGLRVYNNMTKEIKVNNGRLQMDYKINPLLLTLFHLGATLSVLKAWPVRVNNIVENRTFWGKLGYESKELILKAYRGDFKALASSMRPLSRLKAIKEDYIERFKSIRYAGWGGFLSDSLHLASSIGRILAIFQPIMFLGELGVRKIVDWSSSSEKLNYFVNLISRGILGKYTPAISACCYPLFFDAEGNPVEGGIFKDGKWKGLGLFALNLTRHSFQGALSGASFGIIMQLSRPFLEPVFHRLPLFSRSMKYLEQEAGDFLIGRHTQLGRLLNWRFLARAHTFVGEEFFKEGIFADSLIRVTSRLFGYQIKSIQAHGISEALQEVLTDVIGKKGVLTYSSLQYRFNKGKKIKGVYYSGASRISDYNLFYLHQKINNLFGLQNSSDGRDINLEDDFKFVEKLEKLNVEVEIEFDDGETLEVNASELAQALRTQVAILRFREETKDLGNDEKIFYYFARLGQEGAGRVSSYPQEALKILLIEELGKKDENLVSQLILKGTATVNLNIEKNTKILNKLNETLSFSLGNNQGNNIEITTTPSDINLPEKLVLDLTSLNLTESLISFLTLNEGKRESLLNQGLKKQAEEFPFLSDIFIGFKPSLEKRFFYTLGLKNRHLFLRTSTILLGATSIINNTDLSTRHLQRMYITANQTEKKYAESLGLLTEGVERGNIFFRFPIPIMPNSEIKKINGIKEKIHQKILQNSLPELEKKIKEQQEEREREKLIQQKRALESSATLVGIPSYRIDKRLRESFKYATTSTISTKVKRVRKIGPFFFHFLEGWRLSRGMDLDNFFYNAYLTQKRLPLLSQFHKIFSVTYKKLDNNLKLSISILPPSSQISTLLDKSSLLPFSVDSFFLFDEELKNLYENVYNQYTLYSLIDGFLTSYEKDFAKDIQKDIQNEELLNVISFLRILKNRAHPDTSLGDPGRPTSLNAIFTSYFSTSFDKLEVLGTSSLPITKKDVQNYAQGLRNVYRLIDEEIKSALENKNQKNNKHHQPFLESLRSEMDAFVKFLEKEGIYPLLEKYNKESDKEKKERIKKEIEKKFNFWGISFQDTLISEIESIKNDEEFFNFLLELKRKNKRKEIHKEILNKIKKKIQEGKVLVDIHTRPSANTYLRDDGVLVIRFPFDRFTNSFQLNDVGKYELHHEFKHIYHSFLGVELRESNPYEPTPLGEILANSADVREMSLFAKYDENRLSTHFLKILGGFLEEDYLGGKEYSFLNKEEKQRVLNRLEEKNKKYSSDFSYFDKVADTLRKGKGKVSSIDFNLVFPFELADSHYKAYPSPAYPQDLEKDFYQRLQGRMFINKEKDVYKKFEEEGDGIIKDEEGRIIATISTLRVSSKFRKELIKKMKDSYKEGERVLSIGIGDGTLEKEMVEEGIKVVGLEVSEGLIRMAEEKGVPVRKVPKKRRYKLPFEDNSFRVVIFPEVTEHLDINYMFAEAKRVLKPEGKILIASNIKGKNREVKTQQSEEEFEKVLKRNSFKDIRIEELEDTHPDLGNLQLTLITASIDKEAKAEKGLGLIKSLSRLIKQVVRKKQGLSSTEEQKSAEQSQRRSTSSKDATNNATSTQTPDNEKDSKNAEVKKAPSSTASSSVKRDDYLQDIQKLRQEWQDKFKELERKYRNGESVLIVGKELSQEVERIIKEVVTRLNVDPSKYAVIIFGSAARGTMTLDTDVDLMVIGEDSVSAKKLEEKLFKILRQILDNNVDLLAHHGKLKERTPEGIAKELIKQKSYFSRMLFVDTKFVSGNRQIYEEMLRKVSPLLKDEKLLNSLKTALGYHKERLSVEEPGINAYEIKNLGIRPIDHFVWLGRLINGINESNTLKALDKLVKKEIIPGKHISPQDVTQLKEAYEFFLGLKNEIFVTSKSKSPSTEIEEKKIEEEILEKFENLKDKLRNHTDNIKRIIFELSAFTSKDDKEKEREKASSGISRREFLKWLLTASVATVGGYELLRWRSKKDEELLKAYDLLQQESIRELIRSTYRLFYNYDPQLREDLMLGPAKRIDKAFIKTTEKALPIIKEVAHNLQIDWRILATVRFVEVFDLATWEKYTDRYLKFLDTSIGPYQIKVSTAKEIMNRHPWIKEKFPYPEDKVAYALENDERFSAYIAGYYLKFLLKEFNGNLLKVFAGYTSDFRRIKSNNLYKPPFNQLEDKIEESQDAQQQALYAASRYAYFAMLAMKFIDRRFSSSPLKDQKPFKGRQNLPPKQPVLPLPNNSLPLPTFPSLPLFGKATNNLSKEVEMASLSLMGIYPQALFVAEDFVKASSGIEQIKIARAGPRIKSYSASAFGQSRTPDNEGKKEEDFVSKNRGSLKERNKRAGADTVPAEERTLPKEKGSSRGNTTYFRKK